jgi:hypothetical protein
VMSKENPDADAFFISESMSHIVAEL